MEITGKDIWIALEKEFFLEDTFVFTETAKAFKKYIENFLINGIKGMLNKPVTVVNLLVAKVLYCKNLLDNNFWEKLVEAIPEKEIYLEGEFTAGKFFPEYVEYFIFILESAQEDAKVRDFPEEVFYSLRLNEDNITKAKRGELTIGELLMSQPSVILSVAIE